MDQVQIQSSTPANVRDHPSSSAPQPPQPPAPEPTLNPPTTPQKRKRTFTIRPATTPSDMSTARTLFELYRTWLDIDLSFQNYAEELANLPGKYAATERGVLLIAWDGVGGGGEGEGEGSEEEEEKKDGEGDGDADEGEKGIGKALGCVALRTLVDHSSSSPPSPSSSPPSKLVGKAVEGNEEPTAISASPPKQKTYAELKRLYVRPTARNRGVGKALLTEAVRRARDDLKVDGIRMDALRQRSREAMGLYERLGFCECEAYYENLVEGVVFLELVFDDEETGRKRAE